MTNLMKVRRAGFESGINIQSRRRNDVGDYVLPSIQDRWSGWNAALDSVVVELPEPHYEFDGDPAPEMMASDVIKAIHAAGVRTK